jgi:CTP:molybdopterin cytidylyltransferase MocA
MPPSNPELHVLLLAAGNASRFGSAKQTALVGGVSMVRRAALAALGTGAGLVVVTGAYADEVARELAGLSLSLRHNAEWQQGMGGSIARGFRQLLAVAPPSVAAIVMLADQPLIGTGELQRLIRAHREAPERIIAADHGTTLGPPCLFPRRYYEELSALSGPQGARRVLEEHRAQVVKVSMPEAAIDIDTRLDYERLSIY